MKGLKVVHINTSGVGGAAIACHRLHHLMLESGVQSNVIHLYNNHKLEKEFQSIGYTNLRRYFNRIVYEFNQKDLVPKAYVFSMFAPLSSQIHKHPLILEADVIYLHWVLGGFFSRSDFEKIAKLGKPVFCYTHDMWWITGGCHHAFECNGYKTGCKSCPKHKHFSFITREHANWKLKFYKRNPNVRLISPSNWLKSCVDASFLVEDGRCDVIPNVVPDSIFKPMDKKAAREKLGLPHDKIIILFGTADNTNLSKGLIYLVQALKVINSDKVLLCIYGSDYDEAIAQQVSLPIHFLGRITDEKVMAMINASADLFVSPTLAESFGLTLLENIKCGTPVLSTKTSAVPEIVKEGVSGYLVEPRNSSQITDAILTFIENPLKISGSSEACFTDRSILIQHLNIMKKALSHMG